MKKLALLLALLIACFTLAACERKCQCVTVPTPDEGCGDDTSVNITPTPDTSDEGGADVKPEADSGKCGHIDFRATRYNETLREVGGAEIIRNNDELMGFYSENQFAILDAYEEEYFDNKAVIFATVAAGSGSAMLNVKSLRTVDNRLQIAVTYRMPECGTDDMQYATYVIEVAKEDILDIDDVEILIEYTYTSQLYDSVDTSAGKDFELYRYDGSIAPIEATNMFEACGWIETISDEYEFEQFRSRYDVYMDFVGTPSFLNDFAEQTDENFFEEKAIIAIPYYLIDVNGGVHSDSYFKLGNIVVDDDGVALYFWEEEYSVKNNGVQLAVVDKEVVEKRNFAVFYAYMEQEQC
ncbi:MAG: hypothetical protein IKU23_04550 [Clostridia bacterium]|nr:hypothetical protein [Clostridia bacterium]